MDDWRLERLVASRKAVSKVDCIISKFCAEMLELHGDKAAAEGQTMCKECPFRRYCVG